MESSSSSEVYGDPHKKNYQYTSDSSEYNHHTRKIKFKPYEEISGEFKKIKPLAFNGETDKGEEDESWLSRMKKYFQIYNYFQSTKSQNGHLQPHWEGRYLVVGPKMSKRN